MSANNQLRTVVIVGATSTIAEVILAALIERGVTRAHLVARSVDALQAIQADMTTRYAAVQLSIEATDLLDPVVIQETVTRISKGITPDLVLIAQGTMPTQEDQQADLSLAQYQMLVTGVSPVLWLEAFVNALPKGIFAVIGSVAGDRGRKSNYLYGASKALIETVTQGMQNRFAKDSEKTVVLLKPGPTKSKMTANLNQSGLASAESVAKELVGGLLSKKAVVYAPAKWQLIMNVVRFMPRTIFNRTNL